jgi:tetratricopeptide (TPR) repeat protein
MRLTTLFLVPILIFISAAGAQESGSFTVRGCLFSEGVTSSLMTIELAGSRGTTQNADLSGNGSFEFRNVAPGQYELRVTHGIQLIHSENVYISGPNQLLTVNLNSRVPLNRDAGGTISVRQLQHQVPSEAWKEFRMGQKAADKADHLLAVEHLNKAIAIDPQFADAYNNLGAARSALGHLEEAKDAFEKASELVPDHPLALANLSIVLYKLKHFEDCAVAARRALRLNPTLLNIQYILAISLSMQNGNETEDLGYLDRVALEIPQARLLAADILVRIARPEDAAKQLESYLRVIAAEDAQRPTVEQWLAGLRK